MGSTFKVLQTCSCLFKWTGYVMSELQPLLAGEYTTQLPCLWFPVLYSRAALILALPEATARRKCWETISWEMS